VLPDREDYLAEVVRVRPDRSAAFATTPLQHPEEGADELARAVEQFGLAGTMLFGQIGGRYLDDRSFDPFWERAELRGPTWRWRAETATHALRLMFAEVLDRFPWVRVILGHTGETLPFFL
jgi:2,3-dihydroxybenzoate decarboxylase